MTRESEAPWTLASCSSQARHQLNRVVLMGCPYQLVLESAKYADRHGFCAVWTPERHFQPFREYLRSAVSLETRAAKAGGVISGGHKIDEHDIPQDVMEEMLDQTFERYFHNGALMGTPGDCLELVWRLKQIGVNEIACLIDFGVPDQAALAALEHLTTLKESTSPNVLKAKASSTVNHFMDDLEE